MNIKLPFALCLLALAGCQALPAPDTDTPTAEPVQTAQQTAPKVPSRNFAPDTLYDLLVAELAGQRQQPAIALQRYQRQVDKAQSPRVAERALHIAEYMQERPLALHSASSWARLDPGNAAAHRAAALEQARAGQLSNALQHISSAMQLEPDHDNQYEFIAFAASHADDSLRPVLLEGFTKLYAQHPEHHEFLLGQAILLHEQDPAEALRLIKKMPASNNIPAQAMLARLYQQLDRPEDSLAIQRRLLELRPDNNNLRLNHARQLISLNRLEEARNEFVTLVQNEPDNDDFRLGLAYLYMDLEAWQEAMVYLQELLERDSYTETAHFNLGRSLEALEQPMLAMPHYLAIRSGQFFLAARQHIGRLWLEQDNLEQFERSFQDAKLLAPDEDRTLRQIEIEVLNRNQHEQLAWQKTNQALQHHPNDSALLYTRAMQAEKRDDLNQLEHDLRQILADDPDNAMALNALGYTLTDRTDRHAEAFQLIQRAHELQPDDAATLDSLGWVYYHLGNPAAALPLLEEAYAAYPDPEVAAHLGEVLWALGEKRKARKIWRDALNESPADSILLDTLQRLDPRNRGLK